MKDMFGAEFGRMAQHLWLTVPVLVRRMNTIHMSIQAQFMKLGYTLILSPATVFLSGTIRKQMERHMKRNQDQHFGIIIVGV